MKTIKVKIEEIDKGSKNLSIFNLRDEIANFLYRDTIASSARIDQLFFVLIFFAGCKNGNQSLLETILEVSLPKLENLNDSFHNLNRQLRTGEYTTLKSEVGLDQIFKFDLFFILAEAISRLDVIQREYAEFLSGHKEISEALSRIEAKYGGELAKSLARFSAYEIADERVDVNGRSQDMGKSVYRMVHMRNARNLNVNLQKYTTVQDITSRSPIVVVLLQHMDPQMIFDLWDKYHVAAYASGFWDGLVMEFNARVDLNQKFNLNDLIMAYAVWKMERDKPKREQKHSDFVHVKNDESNRNSLEAITLRATKSVLDAPQHLTELIRQYRVRLRRLESTSIELQDKEAIEKLKDQIAQLENLRVSAELEATDEE